MTPWTHSLKDWEKVNLDAYKFLFDQAEKRFTSVFADSEKITTRVYGFIGLLVPIISVCLGYTFTQLQEKKCNSILLILALLCIIVLIGCLWFLIPLIRSRKIKHPGRLPSDYLISEYVEQANLNDTLNETLKFLHLRELENLQEKIDETDIQNRDRIKVFQKCLDAVVGTTIVVFVIIIAFSIYKLTA